MLQRVLFSFLLLVSIFSFAQNKGTLKGVIKDKSTGETLPGATIQLLHNLSKGTASDIEGNYTLELDSGSHVVLFGFVGLKSDTVEVTIFPNQTTNHDVMLKPMAKMLETIVVSSGKFEQKLEELTVSMEVIKPDLIHNKNSTSIESALEQAPGLSIIDNDPQIRGGSGFTFGVGSRVAIVVDGIPLLSGDAGRPEWSYIPIENIEQVEIIKGASSVLYGSSALNGVINVRTAYPRSKPKTIINYSLGQYSIPDKPAQSWYNGSIPGFTNLNFLHSRVVKNNLDLVIGGNLNADQGYIGPPPPAKYIPSDVKNALKVTDTIPTFTNDDMMKLRGRVNFNLRYRFKKIVGLNAGINGNFMASKGNMVLAWMDDSTGIYRGYPGAVFMQNQTLFNVDPFIKYNPGKGVSHSLVTRIFHSDNYISNNQSNRGTMYYGEYQLQRDFKNIDLVFTGGLVGNISSSFAKLYASSGTPNNKIVNASGFIQLDKKMWDVLNVSGGVRYEYFKMNNLQSVVAPIFRAGASLQVLKGTWVRASYGQGYRYPTITERYITTKAGIFGVFPNPDLQPEQSKSFEMGLKQGFRLFGVKGFLDVAGFYQKYKNTIEYLFGAWDPEIAIIGFKFVNTGDSRVRGIDCSLGLTSDEAKKIGIQAMIGYTYIEPVSLTPDSVYARDKSLGGIGQDLSYKSASMDTTDNILKYRFKHMFKADAELKIYGFTVGFSYRYYSRMQNIDRAFESLEVLTSESPYFYPIKATRYWKMHHGFEILDLRIGCKLSPSHKVSFIVNNLLNAAYSLRPMKIEAPRTVSLQYVYTIN
ncbi:MAG: TonB-dependent receptor [Bacteroidia bacterium]|nr:TonB-dependent receptor [Bacteroidia bacterium]